MDEFDGLLRQWRAHGGTRDEFWGSELWEVARALGIRGDGEEPDDPVIVGTRSLVLKSDDGGAKPGGTHHDPHLDARMRAGAERVARERAAKEAAP